MTLRRVLKDIPHLAGKSAAELQSLWTDTAQLNNDDLRRLSNAYFAHIGSGSSRHLHSNGNAGWSRRWLEGCWQRNHKNGYEKTLSSMSSSQNSSPTAGGHSGAGARSRYGPAVVDRKVDVIAAATNSSSTATDASNREVGRSGNAVVTLASSSDSPMFPQPLEPHFVGTDISGGVGGTTSNRLKLTQTVQHHLEKTVRHPLEKSAKSATHRTPTVSSQNTATGSVAVDAADAAAATAAQVDAATKDGNVSLGSV
jgi:hypothetical protein